MAAHPDSCSPDCNRDCSQDCSRVGDFGLRLEMVVVNFRKDLEEEDLGQGTVVASQEWVCHIRHTLLPEDLEGMMVVHNPHHKVTAHREMTAVHVEAETSRHILERASSHHRADKSETTDEMAGRTQLPHP